MFLIDKYTPKDVEDVLFHQDIYELLKNMAKDESIPHIIFHGAGKKTMVKIFLQMLFDPSVHDTYDAVYKVVGSSNKPNNEIIKKSDYHIEIKPKHTNYDRYLIHDVVKDYAKRIGFYTGKTKREFKVIQISDLDNFPFYAQTALRRTMENYSDKCRFIMWCDSLSNVIRPVQSRCICIRLPSPSKLQMLEYVCNISAMENINLSLKDIHSIVTKNNGDIKGALWSLELHKADIKDKNDYNKSLQILVRLLMSRSIEKIDVIRDIIFKIAITTFSHVQILKDIVLIIMNHPKIADNIKIELIVKISELEHNLIRSRRAITQFDAIVLAIMNIINKNK